MGTFSLISLGCCRLSARAWDLQKLIIKFNRNPLNSYSFCSCRNFLLHRTFNITKHVINKIKINWKATAAFSLAMGRQLRTRAPASHWEGFKASWMGPGATCCDNPPTLKGGLSHLAQWKVSLFMAGVEMSFKLPSNLNHSRILWFYGSSASISVWAVWQPLAPCVAQSSGNVEGQHKQDP